MTGFVPVERATATGTAAELLADVQKTLGLTPNMTEVMATSPRPAHGLPGPGRRRAARLGP